MSMKNWPQNVRCDVAIYRLVRRVFIVKLQLRKRSVSELVSWKIPLSGGNAPPFVMESFPWLRFEVLHLCWDWIFEDYRKKCLLQTSVNCEAMIENELRTSKWNRELIHKNIIFSLMDQLQTDQMENNCINNYTVQLAPHAYGKVKKVSTKL